MGNFFLSHKILSHHVNSLKLCYFLTVSRDLASLPIVRGWETFCQSGKLLSIFEKVSHPLNPCGCKAQRHRWETGKLFLAIFFERHNKL